MKVLLLEDEKILGKVYKKNLERAGFEVVWTKTVSDLERKVLDFTPDVVLLDHGIRGYEKAGIDLIAELRAIIPRSKILMLSNYSDFQLQKRALEEGADAYFVKINTPPRVLVSAIQSLLKPL